MKEIHAVSRSEVLKEWQAAYPQAVMDNCGCIFADASDKVPLAPCQAHSPDGCRLPVEELAALVRKAGKETLEKRKFVKVLRLQRDSWRIISGPYYILHEDFVDGKRVRFRAHELRTGHLGKPISPRVDCIKFRDMSRGCVIPIPLSVTENQIDETLDAVDEDAQVKALKVEEDKWDEEIKRLKKERSYVFTKRLNLMEDKALEALGLAKRTHVISSNSGRK